MSVGSSLALGLLDKFNLEIVEVGSKKNISIFQGDKFIISGFAQNIVLRNDFLSVSNFEVELVGTKKKRFRVNVDFKINDRRIRLLSAKGISLVWQIKDGKNYIHKKYIEGEKIWNIYSQIFKIEQPLLTTKINEYEIAWFFNKTLEYELRNFKNNTFERSSAGFDAELSVPEVIEHLIDQPVVIKDGDIDLEYTRFLIKDLEALKIYELSLLDNNNDRLDILFQVKTEDKIYQYSYLDLLLSVDDDYILYYNNLINYYNEKNRLSLDNIDNKFLFCENIIKVGDVSYLRDLNNFIEYIKNCSIDIVDNKIVIANKPIAKSSINPYVWFDKQHSVFTVVDTGAFNIFNCFSWFGHAALAVEYIKNGKHKCKKIHIYVGKDSSKPIIDVSNFKGVIKNKTRSWIRSIDEASQTVRDAKKFSSSLNVQLLQVCFNIFAKSQMMGSYNCKEDAVLALEKQKKLFLNNLRIKKLRNRENYKLYVDSLNCLYFVNFLLNRVGINLTGWGGVSTPKIIIKANGEVSWIKNYINLNDILSAVKRIADLKINLNSSDLTLNQRTAILHDIEFENNKLEELDKIRI